MEDDNPYEYVPSHDSVDEKRISEARSELSHINFVTDKGFVGDKAKDYKESDSTNLHK